MLFQQASQPSRSSVAWQAWQSLRLVVRPAETGRGCSILIVRLRHTAEAAVGVAAVGTAAVRFAEVAVGMAAVRFVGVTNTRAAAVRLAEVAAVQFAEVTNTGAAVRLTAAHLSSQ